MLLCLLDGRMVFILKFLMQRPLNRDFSLNNSVKYAVKKLIIQLHYAFKNSSRKFAAFILRSSLL